MKKLSFLSVGLFLCFIFCFSSLSGLALADVCIISDIDDTVKITNVGTPESWFRGPFSTKSFAGMAQLYRALTFQPLEKRKGPRIYFVSGSFETLREPLQSLLEKNNFPPSSQLTLKDVNQNISQFKIDQIKKIMEGNSKDQFILIGDDTQCDPEIYSYFQSNYASKVLAVYIHKIVKEGRNSSCRDKFEKNEDICKGQIPFYTALDIALHEKGKERLNSEQAQLIADTIRLEEFDKNTIIPYFAACPQDYQGDYWLEEIAKKLNLGNEFNVRIGEIQDKVKNICNRNKKIIESLGGR